MLTPTSLSRAALLVALLSGTAYGEQTFYKIHSLTADVKEADGQQLFVDDINADGLDDILLVTTSGLQQFLGGKLDELPTTINFPERGIAYDLADINNDGYLDLVHRTSLYYGTSNGLSKTVSKLTGTIENMEQSCNRLALLKLNSDDLLDMVCEFRPDEGLGLGSRAGFGFRAFINQGNAMFNFSQSDRTLVYAAIDYKALIKGDINNDGNIDLVTLSEVYTGNTARNSVKDYQVLASLLNRSGNMEIHSDVTGSDTLLDPLQWTIVPYADLSDVNGDGYLDVVMKVSRGIPSHGGRNTTKPSIFTFLGDGTGAFSADYVETPLPIDSFYGDMNLADINGDNIPDAIVTYSNSYLLETQLGATIQLGVGDGSFNEPSSIDPDIRRAVGVDTGDINNDGQLDIVVATGWSPGKIIVYSMTDDPELRHYCEQISSDSDGDGWGWENGKSCEVTDQTLVDAEETQTDSPGTVMPETPNCSSAMADTDGDGWGWENNKSCLVVEDVPQVPDCQRTDSDTDGDGWGWENSRSCRIR